MKKIISNLGVILIGSVLVCSCGGNSVESDAKKYADIMCKSQKLAKKRYVEGGEAKMVSSLKESQKLMLEAASLNKEMIKKYNDPSDYEEFTAAYLKALRKCK